GDADLHPHLAPQEGRRHLPAAAKAGGDEGAAVMSAGPASPPTGKPEPGVVFGADARNHPVRLLVLQGEPRPRGEVEAEPVVMTVPPLVWRELIAFLCLSLGLVLMALFFDAPLEESANPVKTPNPAKAPWYFLGLQELLHYYPPLVAGVLL